MVDVVTMTQRAGGPQAAGVREKAADLSRWLADEAQGIDAAGRIPETVFSRLVEADLFRMTQPKLFGGLGLAPAEAWEAVFEVARGCSSAAWLVGLTSANVMLVSRFSQEAQREVFLCGEPAVVPMQTGGVGFDMETKRVEGGILLSGHWRYASGIDHATWVGLLVPVPAEDGGAPEPHIVLVPRAAFTVDEASWQVIGMRGTGSRTISLAPTFVPVHRWMSWAVLQAGGRHPTCPDHGPLRDYPLNPLFAMSVGAPTVGVVSAVAEEYRGIVRGRVASGTKQKQWEDRIAQIEVASGEATMALLRQNLLADARALALGGAPLPEERAAVRMRLAVSSRLALAAAQRMFSSLGGSLVPTGTRIERLFRDVHAMSSHFLLQPEPIGESYGRLLLGLDLPPGARI